MSERVREGHRELVITDQCIEPHSPWKNTAELNGAKNLKKKCTRTGTTDSMSLLVQD